MKPVYSMQTNQLEDATQHVYAINIHEQALLDFVAEALTQAAAGSLLLFC